LTITETVQVVQAHEEPKNKFLKLKHRPHLMIPPEVDPPWIIRPTTVVDFVCINQNQEAKLLSQILGFRRMVTIYEVPPLCDNSDQDELPWGDDDETVLSSDHGNPE
jgi:hypothetical protein